MIKNKSILRVGDIILFQIDEIKFYRLILKINPHEIKVFMVEDNKFSQYSNDCIFNNPKYFILNNQ